MDRHDVDWKGFWIATTTPFADDGSLDEAALRQGMRSYPGMGITGVLVNGTTGEWFSQTGAERRRVAEIAVEELRGTIPVVIGCTTFTAVHTGELARHAETIGADGVLSTPPPYVVPSPREVVRYFDDLSDYVDKPIMVYNWPRGTNVEIKWDTAVELVKIKNVVAIKDSTANRLQMIETLENVGDKVRIFASLVSRLGLAVIRGIGGDGNIDGGPMAAPFGSDFYESVWRGDDERAKTVADRYVAMMSKLSNPDFSCIYGTLQAQYKACMNMMGQPGGYPRLPILPIEDAKSLAALREILTSAGLLEPTTRAKPV